MEIHLENPVPCPFCGSQRIVKGERYFAMCVDCGAIGPERNAHASVRKFVGDWNTRYGFAAFPDVTSPLETEGGTAIQRIAVVGEAATVCDVCQREFEEKPYHVEMKLCHCCMGVLYDQRRVPNS